MFAAKEAQPMDERKQIAEDTLDQLIEQALRELDRVEPDGLAEERMSDTVSYTHLTLPTRTVV